ncbi:probable RNA-binding protein CG14230 [Diorhabda sublineata]|uniref:probable RNA-binding protein CG14230 n=1 Tax=Diorhabda sublineata TaxID=1163346 RepID=UPI0024E17845|nr:probable RNA-binding protein CG14230 [Diorhabda sublineata]
MKLESNRIFISDLPETATKEQIESAFGNYGEIISIEIKERKELGQKNISLFFAYVTIKIDAKSLNQCFNDFSKGKWLGQRVILQIARESFLDRLKRERESIPKTENIMVKKYDEPEKKINGLKAATAIKTFSSDLDSTSENEKDEEKYIVSNNNIKNNSSSSHISDVVIKNNKGKSQLSKSLKIESVGKAPIIKIELQKKKTVNTTTANLKRLESLKLLKQGYQNQKNLIKSALSNVDSASNNKIVFDDNSFNPNVNNIKQTSVDEDKSDGRKNKNTLFVESDSEEDFEANFTVKKHFQGKEGQKLLELQSKYKNDKRFTLDQRFLDNEQEEEDAEPHNIDNEDISLEAEKKKEYEILEEVLGKKITRKAEIQSTSNKSMLRFDPSQPEHSKFVIPKPLPEKKEQKRKRKNSDTEITEEKRAEEKAPPEVSKEVFYKVVDNLKQSFEEKKEFSLLSMFGHHDETEHEGMETETQVPTNVNNKFQQEQNPFKYDSSDEEDQTEDIPSKTTEINSDTKKISNEQKTRSAPSWTDPFFFKLDDYRLQEGFDFVEKMKLENNTEFTKLRRDLKGIVKAKVRNNLRKNKPFKKKLGGSRKKKVLRIKKAMKR